MSNLRVVSLQAANVLRLTAVDIAWDPKASTLTVGGANGAGKSSVLNIVAMALGGAALCPDEPIHRGASEGFAEVNLGELIVRREFSREKIVEPVEGQDQQATRWGETKSKLIVRNAEGISLGTPQAILNKLVGKLTFDPLQFAFEEPKRQEAILRQIVGLDVSQIEEQRKVAYERRATWNKEHKAAEAVLSSLTLNADVPADEVPLAEVSNEMLRAEELRKLADEADRAVAASEARRQTLEGQCQTRYARIDELNKQVAALQGELGGLEAKFEDEARNVDALKISAESARAVVPDVQAIRKKLAEVEDVNAKVRANKTYEAQKARVEDFAQKAKLEDGNVRAAEQAKVDALAKVAFPVQGLGIDEATGVTFNGLPFKQASTAEQIKTSVAVGFALNPGLKLLLIRNGNALDEDSLKMVAAQADAAGGQILMEYVTKDASEVSVMIEDGHVA